MFSKELENLIQATLEDGVLEDYEKAALVKRAQAEGVDLTELEIYINSILQKRKRELEDKKKAQRAEVEQKRKDAMGEFCPHCHAPYVQGTTRCASCGFEYVKTANKSAQKLAEGIQNIRKKDRDEQEKERASFIRNFPIPTNRDDLLDFIISMDARVQSSDGDECDAYKAKLGEAVGKARVYFANDPQFASLLDKYKGISFWLKTKTVSSDTKFVIFLVVMFSILGILGILGVIK